MTPPRIIPPVDVSAATTQIPAVPSNAIGGAYFMIANGRRPTLQLVPPAPFQFPSLEHLDERVDRLLKHARSTRGIQASTYEWSRRAYRQFRAFLKTSDERAFLAGDLTAQCRILEHWIADMRNRGVSHVSVNSYWRAVRCIFRWLGEEDGTANPLLFVPTPRVGRIVPRVLPRSAAEAVLRFARNSSWSSPLEQARNLVIVALMLLAGLRLGEVSRLLMGDVDLENKTLRIARGKGEGGGKDRTAYMTPQLEHIITNYIAARRKAHKTAPEFLVSLRGNKNAGRGAIWAVFQHISRQTGIRIAPHMLRHTYATLLRQQGIPDRIAMELLGHSSLGMLQRYSHIFDGEAGAAAERLQLDIRL